MKKYRQFNAGIFLYILCTSHFHNLEYNNYILCIFLIGRNTLIFRKEKKTMYIVFFLIWIIFNGQITVEITLFGIAIAAVMYLFIVKFMGYKPKYDIIIAKKLGLIIKYVAILLVEIVKANWGVIKLTMSSKYEIEPAVVHFRTDLKTDAARVVLANSITLTPGTITVFNQGDLYVVHCLDKSMAEGLDSSIFVEQLRKLEEVGK